jgi:hypothetical protein
MRFQDRLRELKGEMSEADLAKASGLPYATVHNYILGRRKPSFEAVVKLAAALGTDCRAFAECITDTGTAKVKRPHGRSQKKK